MTKLTINWEDEDTDFEDNDDAEKAGRAKMREPEADFLSMMNAVEKGQGQTIKVGQRIKAVIALISPTSDDVMLELGGKESAVISKQELANDKGEMLYKIGDTIEAAVVSAGKGEVVLSNSMTHKVAREQAMETAYSAKVPVKGKVIKANKGGFEVRVMNKSAFCPISQIDLNFVEDVEPYIGKEFDFIIQEIKGRNIVVSRAALLREKARHAVISLRERMEKEPIVRGVVTQLRDYGAMVDVGGVTGIVHISELSHSRVAHPSDVVRVGQEVLIKILNIEEGAANANSLPRISLSIKQAQGDPWSNVFEEFKVGDSVTGKVVKLADFGAFVELRPGIDGLVHLSQLSWLKRVHRPQDVLKIGDRVHVRILDINAEQRRISLSMKSIEEDPWIDVEKRLLPGSVVTGKVEVLRGFGAVVEVLPGVTGMVPTRVLRDAYGEGFRKKASPEQPLEVKIVSVDTANRRILLTLPQAQEDAAMEQEFADYVKRESMVAQQKPASDVGSFGEILRAQMTKK